MSALLKWVGGKRWLVDDLRKNMPPFRDYYEPFCGSAALFFALAAAELELRDPPVESVRREYIPIEALRSLTGTPMPRYVLSDANRALIDTFEAVKARHELVGEHLQRHARAHQKDPARRYARVRSQWNQGVGDFYQRAAAFLYLNRTCFNGLWRVNKSGEFNVPMGRYANPPIYDANRLAVAAKALSLATLRNESTFYRLDASKGDFVYFDPPYDPVSRSSSFVNYTQDMFFAEDQERLAVLAQNLASAGVHVMLSNSDTKFIRSLYKEFRIRKVRRSGSMNSDTSKRGKVAELVITSY